MVLPSGAQNECKVDMDAEIDGLCKLSCINLSGMEERAKVVKDLQSIVNWMNQISDVDVEGISPYDHHEDSGRRLELHDFEDSPDHDLIDPKLILQNAPKKDMNFIIVPKVSALEDS